MRAAQYLRTSTSRQEHSLAYQSEVIKNYASLHGLRVVRDYRDENKSGLDLAHRPGLKSLLHDVISREADFEIILVYDVCRWGRFQNIDESAHYEYICKSAGVPVHYCAEAFANDGSVNSMILKTLRRAMAGEYLRELSARVWRAQARVARSGGKLGGTAGYGLRRLLVDPTGQPKAVMGDGKRKSVAGDHVTYTAGPEDEVAAIKEIYRLFVESDWPIRKIVSYLRRSGPSRPPSSPWTFQVVYRILNHPKYMGCVVFNRTTARLGSRRVVKPKDFWIVVPEQFEALVSARLFERAQEKFKARTRRKSEVQLCG